MGNQQSLFLKCTLRDENARIKYAMSSMQGLCEYMEDARATILDLDGTRSTSFFGVYDGHGGANVALYCANQFHTELIKDDDYQNNLENALGNVFFRMDEQLREYDEWRALANPPGFRFNLLDCLKAPSCVKLFAFLSKGTQKREPLTPKEAQPVWLSLEETRSLLEMLVILAAYSQGMVRQWIYPPITNQTFRMNFGEFKMLRDAQPFRCAGQTRILLGSYRVNVILAMSRSIGDFYLKSNTELPATEQMVTCNPDVRTAVITDDTEFLLIASDGIWDILSSQGAVNFVHDKLANRTTDLHTICEGLLNHCYRSRDNATVILVQFKPAARIPLPPPPAAMPVFQPSATEISSAANPNASAEAKVDTGSEIKED